MAPRLRALYCGVRAPRKESFQTHELSKGNWRAARHIGPQNRCLKQGFEV